MPKKIIFILLFLLSHFSHSSEWTTSGEVVGIYIDLRGSYERILFRHSASYVNPNNACRGDNQYYELKTDAAHSSEAYAYLLSAEATKRKIRVYLEGCGSTSWPLAVLVDSIHI